MRVFGWSNCEKRQIAFLAAKAADGEFLNLYLKREFKKILFIKSIALWSKNEKRNEIISEHLF